MPVAVAFTHPREAPVFLHRPDEVPGAGQVRVRVEACGLGLADFGFFQLDALPRQPLVPGLEAVGRVEAVGPGVTSSVGARVGLTPLASSCGACQACERGLERWCDAATLRGWHRDGFLTQTALVAADRVVPLEALDDAAVMAPLFASGWTAFAAVRATGLGAGHRLGVIGVGGLGHLVVQCAHAEGLAVAAVDLDPHRLALGVSLGASSGLDGRLDAVVVCTPSTQAVQLAARAVTRGGAVVLAAASPAVRFDLSLFDTVMRGVSVRPAFLGSRHELDQVLAWYRRGAVVPRVACLRLDEVPGRFWALRDGGFAGRLVATMG
ncbi:MAG: alcohol dehydrogenase catalytic domain-containing protein [Myxococcaceae bacterium]|jgi:propanol-preferring alcohol dehydrogenase|nr:alcohol dehydrogenase catalytic domain-containing protein [Myxococcaceae bacterium]MCA3014016.1 alcohol dehydrogenase catalytic domain-containing protein [Myxococcaceae bacterium]